MSAAESWSHDALGRDLAESRREVGEIVADRIQTGPGIRGRMDVFSIRPSWTKPFPTCWEVKVSRSDFLSDVRKVKYEKYLPYCRRLYFAVPSGLVQRDEVPEGMGLTCRNENGWHVVKAPTVRPLDHDKYRVMIMSLLLRLYGKFHAGEREDRLARIERYLRARDMGREIGGRLVAEARRGQAALRRAEELRERVATILGRDDNVGLETMVRDVVHGEAAVEAPGISPEDAEAKVEEIAERVREVNRALADMRRLVYESNRGTRL